jgi:hypothetical protein
MRIQLLLISAVLTLTFHSGMVAQQTAPAQSPAVSAAVRFEKYYRTELYMGMSIPGGGLVASADWEKFLSEVVTPLFPDGFTVLDARGQYREASGNIAKEPSYVLVFLYPTQNRRVANAGIEKIRSDYKKRFSQESVLRVDIRKTVSVSF